MGDLILALGVVGLLGFLGVLSWLNQYIADYTVKDSKKKQDDLKAEIAKAQKEIAEAKIITRQKVEQQKELTPDNIIDFWKNRK